MIGWLLLAVGLAGFGYAGWLDLKTTEFPDWIPYALIVSALAIRGGYSLLTWDFSFITNSIIWGLAFLGLGLGFYFLKQWGDGDAWLLGALGFLYPDATGFIFTGQLFHVTLIVNFFMVALLYIIAYTIGLGIVSQKASKAYFRHLRGEIGKVVKITIAFAAATAGLGRHLGPGVSGHHQGTE